MRDHVEWYWNVRTNRPRGWRQRIAHWLCRLAERIDGRIVAAIEVRAEPALQAGVVGRALRAGLDHGERLIEEAVRAEAIERAMRIARPDLFEQDHA